MDNKHYNIHVRGQVQGVFFRASTRHHAEMLELTGFVKNEDDGSVYIEAEGKEAQLKLLVEWCHQGPEHSNVEKVEVEEAPVCYYTEFKVHRNSF